MLHELYKMKIVLSGKYVHWQGEHVHFASISLSYFMLLCICVSSVSAQVYTVLTSSLYHVSVLAVSSLTKCAEMWTHTGLSDGIMFVVLWLPRYMCSPDNFPV